MVGFQRGHYSASQNSNNFIFSSGFFFFLFLSRIWIKDINSLGINMGRGVYFAKKPTRKLRFLFCSSINQQKREQNQKKPNCAPPPLPFLFPSHSDGNVGPGCKPQHRTKGQLSGAGSWFPGLPSALPSLTKGRLAKNACKAACSGITPAETSAKGR